MFSMQFKEVDMFRSKESDDLFLMQEKFPIDGGITESSITSEDMQRHQ